MTTYLPAEIKARRLGHRLAESAEEKRRIQLSATVGLASPSSATKMSALEQSNGGAMIHCRRLLEERGALPRCLSIIRHSATGWAAEKESERMMHAIRSAALLDP